MTWTGPKELKAQLSRLWERGELLRDAVTGHVRFPLRLSIQSPHSADITDRFNEVRAWAAELASECRARGVANAQSPRPRRAKHTDMRLGPNA